jgi:hypothetical protein
LFFLSAQVFAAPVTAQKNRRLSEGPADLIEKAYNLSLQKDRTQAVNILVTAIRREHPTSVAAKEMKSALQEISSAFFGDKAQQLYELSISLRKNDVNQAQARLSDAIRIEPDNLLLLNEAARIHISKGECGTAAEALQKHRRWNPFDEQTLLTAAQAEVCRSEWPAYTALRSQSDVKKGPYALYWAGLEIEMALQEKSEARAKENLELVRKEDPEYPELGYWIWRTEKDNQRRKNGAQQYLLMCKKISAALFRRYLVDPNYCRRTAEVESYLKKGS